MQKVQKSIINISAVQNGFIFRRTIAKEKVTAKVDTLSKRNVSVPLFIDFDLVSYNKCKFTRKFCKLLNFSVKESHFIFNKQLYDQIDSVAVGSPLGPSLANLFMCTVERKFLDDFPSEFLNCAPQKVNLLLFQFNVSNIDILLVVQNYGCTQV